MTSRIRKIAIAVSSLAMVAIAAGPARAGEWVPGGTFDVQRGVGVNFLRYLAAEGEGQMTIRCDAQVGLWVDAGAAGNGALPEGRQAGDLSEIAFGFVRDGQTDQLTLTGELLVRSDGAVMVTVYGEEAVPLAAELLESAERIDVTIGAVTAPVTLDGFAEDIASLANRCDGWPE